MSPDAPPILGEFRHTRACDAPHRFEVRSTRPLDVRPSPIPGEHRLRRRVTWIRAGGSKPRPSAVPRRRAVPCARSTTSPAPIRVPTPGRRSAAVPRRPASPPSRSPACPPRPRRGPLVPPAPRPPSPRRPAPASRACSAGRSARPGSCMSVPAAVYLVVPGDHGNDVVGVLTSDAARLPLGCVLFRPSNGRPLVALPTAPRPRSGAAGSSSATSPSAPPPGGTLGPAAQPAPGPAARGRPPAPQRALRRGRAAQRVHPARPAHRSRRPARRAARSRAPSRPGRRAAYRDPADRARPRPHPGRRRRHGRHHRRPGAARPPLGGAVRRRRSTPWPPAARPSCPGHCCGTPPPGGSAASTRRCCTAWSASARWPRPSTPCSPPVRPVAGRWLWVSAPPSTWWTARPRAERRAPSQPGGEAPAGPGSRGPREFHCPVRQPSTRDSRRSTAAPFQRAGDVRGLRTAVDLRALAGGERRERVRHGVQVRARRRPRDGCPTTGGPQLKR